MMNGDVYREYKVQNLGCSNCRHPLTLTHMERGTYYLHCYHCEGIEQEFRTLEEAASSVRNNERVLHRGFEADETDLHPLYSSGIVLWMINTFIPRGEVYPDVSNARFRQDPDECGSLVVAADVRHVSQP